VIADEPSDVEYLDALWRMVRSDPPSLARAVPIAQYLEPGLSAAQARTLLTAEHQPSNRHDREEATR
jgi:hypothetical protein